MAKQRNTVLQELGLSTSSSLDSFIAKLTELDVVTDNEITGMKNISVKTLPTFVTNNETLVKERMFGITTDENKGVTSLLNKRIVLINQIINKLNAELNSVSYRVTDVETNKVSVGQFSTLESRVAYIHNTYIPEVKVELENEINAKANKEYVDEEIAKLIAEEIDSSSATKNYILPLREASWVRIAKVENLGKNSSGMFTFNCYGIKDDTKEILTTSVFSASCGLDGVGTLVTDVLPITQAPEITGSGASGGSSGEGSSGETSSASEEPTAVSETDIEVTSDGGSSGEVGSGGSGGGTSVYGLTAITIEQYEGEMFVCGLINFPNTEKYTALEVEMRIENNLNYAYLETLEPVELTDVDEDVQQLLEGTTLYGGKEYEYRITCNLQDYINGVNSQKEINIATIDDASSNCILSYDSDGYLYINNEIEYIYTSYPNVLVNLDTLFSVSSLYDIMQITGYNSLEYDNLLYYLNKVCCYENSSIFRRKLKNISGTLTFELVDTAVVLYINDQRQTIYEGTTEYKFENLNFEKDVIRINNLTTNELDPSSIKISIDFENTEVELAIPYITPVDRTIQAIQIENNDVYNFKLKLAELTRHIKSHSYDLFSIYDRLNEIEETALSAYYTAEDAVRNWQLDEANYRIDDLEYRVSELENAGSGGSGESDVDSEPNIIYLENTITGEQYRSNTTIKKFYAPFAENFDGEYHFAYSTIEYAKFDMIKAIGICSFTYCEYLKDVVLPNTLETLSYASFFNTPNLTKISIPDSVTIIEPKCFEYSGLIELNTNNAMLVSGSNPSPIFPNSKNLKRVICPKIEGFYMAYDLTGLSSLEYMDLYTADVLATIPKNQTLKTLILRNTEKVCELTYEQNLTKISSLLTVYVPNELIEQYKIATNWVSIADKIKPLNEYIEEE